SLSPFPILVEDSDSHIEEIDLFLATDDLMPPGIENDDYDSERDIHFLEELISNDPLPLPENESSNFDHHDDPLFPRPPLEPPDVESLSPFPILVEDSDSHIEEIDLFLATDDLMPPGIENDDYDSERDIHFLEELISNDPLPLPENESSNFDHHDDPLFPRPPLEPPDVEVFFILSPIQVF
nr:hypothetical protein [Tanacetum cinerariifolium]